MPPRHQGAIGRTFGIVTGGFSIGGMIGPLMFGFFMDHGAPRWVFGASVVVMIAVALVALVGDRRLGAPPAVRGSGEDGQTIVLVRLPIFSIHSLTTSPGLRNSPRPAPTPGGAVVAK